MGVVRVCGCPQNLVSSPKQWYPLWRREANRIAASGVQLLKMLNGEVA